MRTFPGRQGIGSEDWPSAVSLDEQDLVRRLRGGDETAFATVVERYHGALVRLAIIHVRDREVAEEVTQETWLGVIRGLDRFEGRSSLKTWIFRILTNIAKARGERERRCTPFSALPSSELNPVEPAVPPERFIDGRDPHGAGRWASPPASWEEMPESRLSTKETLARVRAAIEDLPPLQRQVVTLRDIEGWSSEDVCSLLRISQSNQRVLLHRGRSKVRAALETYLGDPAIAAI